MTVNMHEVAEQTVAKIRSAFEVPEISIEYSLALDLGSRMGAASRIGLQYSVKMNPHLFLRADPIQAIETLQHEIAHCYDHAIVRQWGHGPSWLMLMKFLGYTDPQPCHSVAIKSFATQRVRATAWCRKCGKTTGVSLTQKRRLTLGKTIKKSCCFCDSELFDKL